MIEKVFLLISSSSKYFVFLSAHRLLMGRHYDTIYRASSSLTFAEGALPLRPTGYGSSSYGAVASAKDASKKGYGAATDQARAPNMMLTSPPSHKLLSRSLL